MERISAHSRAVDSNNGKSWRKPNFSEAEPGPSLVQCWVSWLNFLSSHVTFPFPEGRILFEYVAFKLHNPILMFVYVCDGDVPASCLSTRTLTCLFLLRLLREGWTWCSGWLVLTFSCLHSQWWTWWFQSPDSTRQGSINFPTLHPFESGN